MAAPDSPDPRDLALRTALELMDCISSDPALHAEVVAAVAGHWLCLSGGSDPHAAWKQLERDMTAYYSEVQRLTRCALPPTRPPKRARPSSPAASQVVRP
jgi:hypothetical protein